MIGSSIALTISDIPFNGPTGSVNVGYVDGEYIINPTIAQREKSRLNITVSGTKDAIMMVEAGADILSEEEVLNAILFAHEEIKSICNFIETIWYLRHRILFCSASSAYIKYIFFHVCLLFIVFDTAKIQPPNFMQC